MKDYIYKLYKQGDYSKTFGEIDNEESNPNLLELKALSALRINRNKEAKDLFENLIKIKEKGSYYYHLGLALLSLQKYSKAQIAFEKSLIDANFKQAATLNQAHCFVKLDKTNKALEVLINLSKQSPQLSQAWFMLLKQLRYSDNLNLFEQKVFESKQHIGNTEEWAKNKLFLSFFQNKFESVLKELDNRQNDVELTGLLAKTHSKLANFSKAVEIYKELLKYKYSDINLYNLAAAYSKLTSAEDLALSIDYANKCLQLNQNYHQAYFCKALAFQKMAQHKQALKNIKKALILDQYNCTYLYTKAELYKLENKKKKSLKVLNKIIKIENSNNQAVRLKGIIKLQQSKLQQSEKYLTRALNIDGTDQRALAYYTITNMAKNQNKQVKKELATEHFVKEYYFNPSEDYLNLETFNCDLEFDIKNHSLLRKNPNGLAARNGYLTDNLFADQNKSILTFKKLLLEKIIDYIDKLPEQQDHFMLKHKTYDFKISSWATWVKGDGFIDKHIHEDSWISGAYYCKIPKITKSTQGHQGYFEYGCIPNDISLSINKEKGYIKPQEGKLVIFPSYMYHQTIPHETNEDRISIAFDLTPNSWIK